MLTGKTVILGVTGSIAAYKIANLARGLKKLNCNVHVLMTENATNFINPITFETLTQNKCLVDTFDRNFEYSVEHVSIAKAADAVLIAPATANVIGKIANGIADDMLTTTVMACTCPIIIAPAMNHNMYHNAIVQDNLNKLQGFGYEIIAPDTGMLANGDIGDGRMPCEETLLDYIEKAAAHEKDMLGKSVLITAGATREAIDPVRFITNHSSGKMGLAMARAAAARGADVTVIKAATDMEFPKYMRVINVSSAEEMYDAVMENADADIIIKAAAVADYTPEIKSDNKIKKSDDDLTLSLKRTKDILKTLGNNKKPNQIICGFSMETENVIENSKKKLDTKNADIIAANSLKTDGAGFGTDTNVITIITREGVTELPIMTKREAADKIYDTALNLLKSI